MATVTMYSPTGNPEVINTLNVEKKLQEGYKTAETWQAEQDVIRQQKDAEWLTSPDTVQERFQLLRAARDARISATDYLMTSDYPISETDKAQVIIYRQALRDLPAQEGAPWDGGGDATPWPVKPDILS